MRQGRLWIAAAALGLFATGPAVATVVVEEDFEDDAVDETTFFEYPLDENGVPIPDSFFDGTFPQRGLGFQQNQLLHINNPPDPTNNGRPGRWLPNQYDVQALGFTGDNGEWFDPLEVNPDENWQLAVVRDFRQMSINADGPPRPGNEGFIINHHQGDCSADSPCTNSERIGFTSYKLALDGYMQFTDTSGTPTPANNGDVVRGRFDFAATGGVIMWGLSSDINQMVTDTAAVEEDINGDGEADHLPLTKWNVGFGQDFDPLFRGVAAWGNRSLHPDIVSVFGFVDGFNQDYHQTWIDPLEDPTGCGGSCSTPVNLDPDNDMCDSALVDLGNCTTTSSDPAFLRDGSLTRSPFLRYQTLEFEYQVGTDFYTKLTLDGQDVVACESGPNSKDCDDPNTAEVPMASVPLSRPGDAVDGIFFAPGGFRNSNSAFFDEICVTINQELDGACTFTRGEPDPPTMLLGDANGDGQVTGADLIAVQQNFGKTGDSPLAGDSNGDGQVTGADLISVQQNFGKALAAPVPEPATIVLLVGCLALCRRQRA